MPPTKSANTNKPAQQKAAAARRLWGDLERWHAQQQKTTNTALQEDLRRMDTLWRSAPASQREPKLKFEERKQQLRIQSDKALATKARDEWNKRLKDAKLQLEDWNDIKPKEQDAVSRILRPDLLERDEDEDDPDLDVEGMKMMDKMLAAPPQPKPSSPSLALSASQSHSSLVHTSQSQALSLSHSQSSRDFVSPAQFQAQRHGRDILDFVRLVSTCPKITLISFCRMNSWMDLLSAPPLCRCSAQSRATQMALNLHGSLGQQIHPFHPPTDLHWVRTSDCHSLPT